MTYTIQVSHPWTRIGATAEVFHPRRNPVCTDATEDEVARLRNKPNRRDIITPNEPAESGTGIQLTDVIAAQATIVEQVTIVEQATAQADTTDESTRKVRRLKRANDPESPGDPE